MRSLFFAGVFPPWFRAWFLVATCFPNSSDNVMSLDSTNHGFDPLARATPIRVSVRIRVRVRIKVRVRIRVRHLAPPAPHLPAL